MVHDGRHKLIYYPAGNHLQLFDLETDPRECSDVADWSDYAGVRAELTAQLVRELYGGDERWADGGRLVGLPDRAYVWQPDRGLANQRGISFGPLSSRSRSGYTSPGRDHPPNWRCAGLFPHTGAGRTGLYMARQGAHRRLVEPVNKRLRTWPFRIGDLYKRLVACLWRPCSGLGMV
jgi:hypothetical protein